MRMIVMVKQKKTIFLLLAMLLILAMSPLAATTRAYEMSGIDPDVNRIQYRLSDRPWSDMNRNDAKFFLFNLDADDILQVRQAREDRQWEDTLSYRLDGSNWRWINTLVYTEPQGAEASIIMSNESDGSTAGNLPLSSSDEESILSEREPEGHPFVLRSTASDGEVVPRPAPHTVTTGTYALSFKTTPSMDHLYAYSAGGGVDLTLSPSHTRWMLSITLAVQHARSTNGWADAFLILDSSVEVGWKLQLSPLWRLVPSLSVGALMHYTIDGSTKDAWYSSLLVAAGLRVELSLSQALHLFVKPAVRLVIDETRVGFMYGTGVGLNVLL